MALLQSGKAAEAEKIARARVARYAIWIRRHTARSINAYRDFAEHLIPVDAHALEHELNLLEVCVLSAGKTEPMVFTYRRLQEVLAVPALARRMVSFAARWLIRNGNLEEACCNSMVSAKSPAAGTGLLLIWPQNMGATPTNSKPNSSKKAVEAALESVERSLALRTLAYHHFFSRRPLASLE